MGRPADFRAYRDRFSDEAKRLGLYPEGGWTSPDLHLVRQYFELDVDAVEAAVWLSLRVGPTAVAELAKRQVTAAEFGGYADALVGPDRTPEELAVPVMWMLGGFPIDVAIAWHQVGYPPELAADRIAEGVGPEMVEAVDTAGRREAVRDFVARTPGFIVDPELADRLGLDD